MSAQKFLLLRADIDRELRQIEALVGECREAREKVGAQPSLLEVRGVGSILHDFYSGIERVLERIATELDGELPQGRDWHIQLLGRMTEAVEPIRPRVIAPELAALLHPYLGFRHLFRHVYGTELRWERCRELAAGMESVWSRFNAEMEEFSAVLKELYEGCQE